MYNFHVIPTLGLKWLCPLSITKCIYLLHYSTQWHLGKCSFITNPFVRRPMIENKQNQMQLAHSSELAQVVREHQATNSILNYHFGLDYFKKNVVTKVRKGLLPISLHLQSPQFFLTFVFIPFSYKKRQGFIHSYAHSLAHPFRAIYWVSNP